MSEQTNIGWCHHTFNPWHGCFKVSDGCKHCYAELLARRYGHAVWGPPATTHRRLFGDDHWREPLRWNDRARQAGERRRVFCASMADVFEDHPDLPTERDLGNCRSEDEFWQHFAFISNQLRRLMKPGRNICVHVAQFGSTVANDGVTGVKDFRGATIRHFIDAGFVYHGDICIDKDPQAQAIRTHSKALLFVQLKRDASWLRPALADYILVFRAPGTNAVPIHPDIDNNQWIEWARPIWYGIRESDTLNVVAARSEKDERHICPLQLGTIERCIRLWSNKGETVLSPFAGIGSELYQAVKLGRQALGVELKPEYYRVAVGNLQRAEAESKVPDMFALAGIEVAKR